MEININTNINTINPSIIISPPINNSNNEVFSQTSISSSTSSSQKKCSRQCPELNIRPVRQNNNMIPITARFSPYQITHRFSRNVDLNILNVSTTMTTSMQSNVASTTTTTTTTTSSTNSLTLPFSTTISWTLSSTSMATTTMAMPSSTTAITTTLTPSITSIPRSPISLVSLAAIVPSAASSSSSSSISSATVTTTPIPSVTTTTSTSASESPSVVPLPTNNDECNNKWRKYSLIANRYLLLDLVDGSTLYKCIDITTKEELVCKIAKNPCTNLLIAHSRLEGHPHVNPLNIVVPDTDVTFLFFTPSKGNLHSYVRRKKMLSVAEAKRLFRQMCNVVKSCHENGIVLRDLKLRKFVFSDKDRTQLRLESLEDAVVLEDPDDDVLQDKRGCPAYVSPEILRANTTYSGKAGDMWSLGVILYTMLMGRYPFNDTQLASLFVKISRGQFYVPEVLDAKARCMIRSLLRREPDERLASEDILYHPWMTCDYVDPIDLIKPPRDQCVPNIDL